MSRSMRKAGISEVYCFGGPRDTVGGGVGRGCGDGAAAAACEEGRGDDVAAPL